MLQVPGFARPVFWDLGNQLNIQLAALFPRHSQCHQIASKFLLAELAAPQNIGFMSCDF